MKISLSLSFSLVEFKMLKQHRQVGQAGLNVHKSGVYMHVLMFKH